MEKSTVLAALTFVTLVSGMAVAAYQLWVTEQAKKKGLGGAMLQDSVATTRSKDAATASRKAGVPSTETTHASPPIASPTDQRENGRAVGSDPSI